MTDSNIREMVVLVLRVILAKDGHDLFFNLAKQKTTCGVGFITNTLDIFPVATLNGYCVPLQKSLYLVTLLHDSLVPEVHKVCAGSCLGRACVHLLSPSQFLQLMEQVHVLNSWLSVQDLLTLRAAVVETLAIEEQRGSEKLRSAWLASVYPERPQRNRATVLQAGGDLSVSSSTFRLP
jgi:hypothetical protein